MAGDPEMLLYGLYGSLFLAVLLLVYGAVELDTARRRRTARRVRRMGGALAAGPETRLETGLETRLETGRLRRARAPSEGATRAALGAGRALGRRLDAAGIATGPHRARQVSAFIVTVSAVLVASLVAAWVFAPPLSWTLFAFGVPLGLAVIAVSAVAYLRLLTARRRQRFASQLPDALDVMVRSLRAGHPVSSAMAMVRSDLPDPIATEFGRAIDEMTYGLELRQALSHMAARVDVPDLRFVVASLNLQHETGGNLAELLQGLSDLMRARVRVARKILAHTAEARLSARFLAIMPVMFVGLVLAANPSVYGEAARDPLFWPIVLGAGTLQVLGILIMGRMARVRV